RGRPLELVPGRLVLEVVPGAERLIARAGHDRDPELGVALEGVEDARQLEARGRMDRVHHLGPRDRDLEQMAVALDAAELGFGHGAPRLRGRSRRSPASPTPSTTPAPTQERRPSTR